MKKFFFIILVALLAPFSLIADWIPFDSKSTPHTPPGVTILIDDQNSTVIKIELGGIDLSDFQAEGENYKVADLLTGTFTSDPGYPEVPYLANILAVPDRAAISLEVIETGETRIFSNISLPPSRISLVEGSPEPPYMENAGIYQSNELFPAEFAKADPPAIFRDFRIARISVFPVHYLSAKKELQVVSSITVRVNYTAGEAINPKITAKKAIAPSYGQLYRSLILNYPQVLESCYGGREEGRELILCIMPDIFAESFQVYADWKRQSGIDVHVTKFSEIGANASNPDIIKAHITDAYHNWEYPPSYVLLVGDDGVCPKKIVVYPDYSFPNEDFFVEVDGNDYFPEMMIGRFTNEAEFRMQVMIHKLLKYEKEPYVQDASWLKKGTCCSNNAYPSQVETKRFAYHKMMDEGNFLAVDTLMSNGTGGSGCTVDLQDVTAAINNGRSFLNYRGEGWYDGWHANCYYFSVSDVAVLNNTNKTPFVTSIGCGVAAFNASGGNCFGEEWMEMGSMTTPRGAAAFLGPTSNTHT
ncbi:MAG: C25 family cysteine peptidase, partial [Bacteroidales bacterium]|nr:C25 family cysteine peptidase [Bacteroidales bacterium]